MSTTIIEKESSSPAAAFLIFVLFALLVVGGAWFAYTHGMIGQPSTVIENHKTIVMPTPSVPAEPAPVK